MHIISLMITLLSKCTGCFNLVPISLNLISQASYIDGLEGEQLYHALFEEDTESERLSLLPGEMERLDELVTTD